MDETHKLPAIWITFRWFQGCRYPPYLLDLWRQTWRDHGSFSAKDTVRKRGGLPVPQSGLTHVVFVDGKGFLVDPRLVGWKSQNEAVRNGAPKKTWMVNGSWLQGKVQGI